MKNGESREHIELAVFSLIEAGLAELTLPATREQISKLTTLVMLVSEWAGRISLTGHRDPLEMAARLVLDAAALSQSLPELDSSTRVADLGSGVGFPGLPIAILRPTLEIALVESRLKRHHLQREARRKLSLTRVIPILGRSEAVEARLSDVVVAQAMAKPAEALEMMVPWTRPGGIAVLPSSEHGGRPELPRGFDAVELREYRVPTTGLARRLWIARASSS
jgi:16S rRNA (guanine527-N7)-methyltransferase